VYELKYDGIWGRMEIGDGVINVWSRNGQLKYTQFTASRVKATLHGEFMFGTAWAGRFAPGAFYAFDITAWGGRDVSGLPLRRRRKMLIRLLTGLDEAWVRIVEQHPISSIMDAWAGVVDKGFEGLVCKSTKGPFGYGWGRIKREFEVDYVCMGFNESDAEKYRGRMVRSVKAGLYFGSELKHVGNIGGLDEKDRAEMFLAQEAFAGRVFTASGKQVFEGGVLRHPNFIGWHGDKLPENCTIESAEKVGGL
jgi:ATP-dependent DNA ligase